MCACVRDADGRLATGLQVNGMNVLAVREAIKTAKEFVSNGNGPMFFEVHSNQPAAQPANQTHLQLRWGLTFLCLCVCCIILGQDIPLPRPLHV